MYIAGGDNNKYKARMKTNQILNSALLFIEGKCEIYEKHVHVHLLSVTIHVPSLRAR